MNKSKVLGGVAAVVVTGIGMDYVIPLLAPLDYVGVSTPRAFFAIPIVVGAFGYLLATWRVWAEQDRRKRRLGYVIRLLFFCLLCGIGFYLPSAYRQRHIEFIPVSDGLHAEDHGIERALGFKVGVQVNSQGKSLFFKREPGASEKVQEWLREHGAQTSNH
ncbi:MAG: hypothetical protein ACLQU3_33360 [Limisphaerales bacterium]